MKPARALLSEYLIPIDIAGLELRHCRMPTIVASERSTHSEAALRKVEAVARRAADAVMFYPAHQRLVHAALINKILKKPADGIIGERGDDRGVQAETTFQPACDVVFPTALAHFKGSRRVDAPVAWVEPHHDFTQADQVPPAVFLRLDPPPHPLTPAALAVSEF